MTKEREVILSLGSNISNRKLFIEQAVFELKKSFQTEIKQSSIYETEPWGFDAELSFLNCCVCFNSSQNPIDLLKITQFIEQKLGRIRKIEGNTYSSRTIDIDILFVGDVELKSKDLKIPHPLLYSRKFVLIPLYELFPEFIDPLSKQSIQDLIKQCNDEKNVILYKD